MERRALPASAGIVTWGPLAVDFLRQSVHTDGREIPLQPLQTRLLGYLVCHSGRCVSHQELREQVFRASQHASSTSIPRQISVLRTRLGSVGDVIITFRYGYGLGVPAKNLAREFCVIE